MVRAVSKGFRKGGYAGSSVDSLSQGCGVTHGGFYSTFGSKAAAFQAAVEFGLREIQSWAAATQAQHGDAWIEQFIALYADGKRTCDKSDGCTIEALSADVERSHEATRNVYEVGLRAIVITLAGGMSDDSAAQRAERATAMLALLVGGLLMARAVSNPDFSAELARSYRKAALAIATQPVLAIAN